jgi:hypothetical protein
LLKGVLEEEELGLYVDPGTLCRRSEPSETDLHGTKFGPTGPSSGVPERRAPHGAVIGEADLSKGNGFAGLAALEMRIQIVLDLDTPRDQRESVSAPVLLCGDGKVRCVASC